MSQAVTGYLPTFTAAKKDMLLWEPESLILLRFRSGPEKNTSSREVSNSAGMFLFDRDGSEWLMTRGHGVLRIPMRNDRQGAISPNDPSIEAFSENEGLTSSTVYCAMEDREGDIWVGTLGGLIVSGLATRRGPSWRAPPQTICSWWPGTRGTFGRAHQKAYGMSATVKQYRRVPPGSSFHSGIPRMAPSGSQRNMRNTCSLALDRPEVFKLRSPALGLAVVSIGRSPKRQMGFTEEPGAGPHKRWCGSLVDLRPRARRLPAGERRLGQNPSSEGEPYITAFGATADCDGRVWLAYPERNAVAMWDRGAIRVFRLIRA